tara:strand:+ start:1856 stop:2035 length:180 start_codon:yes stop_codon:yes gene_type:complete
MDNVSSKSIEKNRIYSDVKKVIEEKRKLRIKIPKNNTILKDDYYANTPKISHREVVIFI